MAVYDNNHTKPHKIHILYQKAEFIDVDVEGTGS